MKNVKLFPLIAFCMCVLFSNSLFAQGIYISVDAGYGFKMGSQNLEGMVNYTVLPDTTITEQVFVPLGKGANLSGAFGYMFNENIGAELGLSYLIGGESVAMEESFDGDTTTSSVSSNMLRIIPSLVISSGLERLINPYAKFGLVVGMGSVSYEVVEDDAGEISRMTMRADGGLALGLKAAAGANFAINNNMLFFGEMGMINMSYAPTRSEITELTSDGVDMLPGMTVRERETEYVNSYTELDNGPAPDESQPDRELRRSLPFGSFGLNVGLRINF